jgi:hypothetical protein
MLLHRRDAPPAMVLGRPASGLRRPTPATKQGRARRASVHVVQVGSVAEAAGSDQLGARDLDAVQLAVERRFPVARKPRRQSSRLSDSVGRRSESTDTTK